MFIALIVSSREEYMSMDPDDEFPEGETEVGSDELLSDDNLRLPEGANILVRLHAVRAWLTRRQQETGIELGEAALLLQQSMHEEQPETRLRRRERQGLLERQQSTQQALQDAQRRLDAYEEAQFLLEECITHNTSGERVLVEYYLTLDELIQNENQGEATSYSPRQRAFSDVQRRIEHVNAPEED